VTPTRIFLSHLYQSYLLTEQTSCCSSLIPCCLCGSAGIETVTSHVETVLDTVYVPDISFLSQTPITYSILYFYLYGNIRKSPSSEYFIPGTKSTVQYLRTVATYPTVAILHAKQATDLRMVKPSITLLLPLVVATALYGDGPSPIRMAHGFLRPLPLLAAPRAGTTHASSTGSTTTIRGRMRQHQRQLHSLATSTEDSTATTRRRQQPRRVGWAQQLLDFALQSPLWKHVLVPAARQKIIDTAQANGILWKDCRAWLYEQEGPWQRNEQAQDLVDSLTTDTIPDWYRQSSYHAYESGHLSWQAAIEIELASAAVGARNVPKAGYRGETVFRQQFQSAIEPYAVVVSNTRNAKFLDIGCATGTSTRWLARQYPEESHQFIGLDLSPYFCAVGTRLLELAPLRERSSTTGSATSNTVKEEEALGEWVCDVQPDARISFQQGNGAATPFADNSFDVVNLQFVAHELPIQVTLDIIREAHRILKPGTGQLWFCEMDFESPAYAAQRANAATFALIRATEPYLDEYADGQAQIWQCLRETFATTVVVPATGRHFAVVATKAAEHSSSVDTDGDAESTGALTDLRFDAAGNYKVEDTHLQVWENKAANK